MNFEFTKPWFEMATRSNWDILIPIIKPQKILEIGVFEGACTCYLIQHIKSEIELHCVDTWEGGIEHKSGGAAETDLMDIEERFHKNTAAAIKACNHKINLFCYKERSITALSRIIAEGKSNYFDFVYIDGSHQAADVLADAVLAFELVKINGVIGFDDYLWSEHKAFSERDPLRCPKLAIDNFAINFFRKLKPIIPKGIGHNQIYYQKVSL